MDWCRQSARFLQKKTPANSRVRPPPFRKSPQSLRRIESELGADALGVGLGLAAVLLRRRLEGAQTADLLENALGIQLVLQPFQRAIDGSTFATDHFWHQYHS